MIHTHPQKPQHPVQVVVQVLSKEIILFKKME